MSLKAGFLFLVSWVFLVPLQVCSSAESPQGIPGIIFTAEETAEMINEMRNPDITGPLWTPSIEQIRAFERDFVNYKQKDTNYQVRAKRSLELYKRQYFGITAQGKKVILVNFFCEQYWKFSDDWRRKVVVSRNYTGDCYFMVRYDPSTREFFDLVFR